MGHGPPRREFLYSDDLAEACVHLLNLPETAYDSLISQDEAPLINIGTGEDLTIRELAELVARVLDFDCELVFDTITSGRHSAEAARCKSNPCVSDGRRRSASKKESVAPMNRRNLSLNLRPLDMRFNASLPLHDQ